MIGKLRNNGPKCKTAYNSLFVKHDKVSFSAIVSIGVTYGGYGGYAYPPLFGVGVPYPPLFGRVIEKITATFPHPALT